MPVLVASTMGTTVSLDVPDRAVDRSVLEAAVQVLTDADARFSTFRSHSEIQRIDRGELSAANAHPDVREVLGACAVLRAESDGAFDAWRGGHLDPSGYVKGWAAERAADVIRRAGVSSFSLNVGGDVVCAGEPEPGRAWRVGVRDPDDPQRILLVLGVRDGAVATSGLYERGAHVMDARTGGVADRWRSLTVLSADLATADALATAGLARGDDGPKWAASRYGCEIAAVDRQGRLWTTPGIEAARVA